MITSTVQAKSAWTCSPGTTPTRSNAVRSTGELPDESRSSRAGFGSRRSSSRRLIDLAARGWYSGETHVHRPPEDMPLLLRSEDLHVAPVLTVWNRTNLWKGRPLPDRLLVEVEPTRDYHLLACEDERQGGALLYFNLKRPLDLSGDGPEFPSPVTHLREVLEQEGAWVRHRETVLVGRADLGRDR